MLPWESIKPGLMILWFGVVFLVAFHFLRKKTQREVRRTWGAFSISALLGFLAVLACFGFSLSAYVEEAKNYVAIPFYEKILPVAFGVAISFGVLGLGLAIARKARMTLFGWAPSPVTKYEYRPLGQVLGCLALGYFAWVDLRIAFFLVLILATTFMLVEYFRLSFIPEVRPGATRRPSRRFKMWTERLIDTAVQRPFEQRLYVPSLFLIIGVALVVMLFPFEVALASILVLALADPIAALVGRRLGRTKLFWNPEKSFEGSCTFFALALAISFPVVGIQVAALVAFSVAVFESLSAPSTDNLVVPLVTGLLLYTFVA